MMTISDWLNVLPPAESTFQLSVFEGVMLLCFGAAWPASIRRSWVSRSTRGKSVVFLWIIWTGYLAGILHKLLYSHDPIIALYMINSILVAVDIVLYYRNRRIEQLQSQSPTAD